MVMRYLWEKKKNENNHDKHENWKNTNLNKGLRINIEKNCEQWKTNLMRELM